MFFQVLYLLTISSMFPGSDNIIHDDPRDLPESRNT